ncbi:hypothetical protein GIB67_028191 [Kingdonia uniflora]|uniref:GPI mannosyltransferase 1 n=1 Tax=Kingdonia uniflora TaxID=39325 RepID=A0A7J7KZ16_9MAGN|nr:hypothetical protein GIB67_028191 [Kingdonia uniflora]
MMSFDFHSMFMLSAVLRVVLIVYGEWQDAHMEVRYTDVDYIVFSDAAALVALGKSPYERSTYRYSPLLAFLLVPNSVIHRSWGKLIFSASDLLVGIFIRSILKLRGVPESLCFSSVVVWLFNPFTFTIGTRGNCEPIVCAVILWIVICLMNGGYQCRIKAVCLLGMKEYLSLNGKVLQSAFWYGLIVHFRIYPIIYALPILLFLDPQIFLFDQKPTIQNWSPGQEINQMSRGKRRVYLSYPWLLLRNLLTRERISFGVISGSTFFLFTGIFFHLYGWKFLHEALLYHLTRTDPRHNFSIYFYHIYLHHEDEFSVLEKLISFLPQLIVQMVLSYRFARDLPFCLFLQTVAFVAFNKVITAQYFVWFFCLWPLILPWSRMKLKWEGLILCLLWMGAQMHWLMWGYLLEFKGKNVFIQLWCASLLFLAANTLVLIMVIRHHRFSPVFILLPNTSSMNPRKIK